jgi:hypothetical protein
LAAGASHAEPGAGAADVTRNACENALPTGRVDHAAGGTRASRRPRRSVPEVAAALGVADTTIRTHVGRLFEKTGVRRQADLVKLVTGYAAPLAG